jgi:hypothetical protein
MRSSEQEIVDTFDSICWKLNRGNVGNYLASIGLFSTSTEDTSSLSDGELVQKILGSWTVANAFQTSTVEEMLLEIAECIGWEGNHVGFPNREYHNTEAYQRDLANAFSAVRNLFGAAADISSFVIENGHPFYPIYWGFAYLLRAPHKSYVFVGSSSD